MQEVRLFAVAVVVDVASTLQGDCVMGERATRQSLGLRLKLASSRLCVLVGMAGMGTANRTDHIKGWIGLPQKIFSEPRPGSAIFGNSY